MKKLLVLFVCISIFSCEKDSVSEDVSTFQAKSIVSLTEQQRLAYSLLDEEEKVIFWKTYLNDAIDNDESLTSSEIDLIDEVIDEISADLFKDDSNTTKEAFKNIFVPDFLARAQTTFAAGKIQHLFYGYTQLTQPGGGTKTCDCNVGSLWGCRTDCQDKSCNEPQQPNDCGFLWMYPCDGLCALFN